MPENIENLRSHLFETLKSLRSAYNPMDLDRARAVADVARVLIDSAKVEVELLKVTGGSEGSGFIPTEETRLPVARRPLELSQRPVRA
jgi:hypothetical protein